uniref:Uncharacterized protein n=2 Tax=Rhizophagus irregularis TaxID=588596 RepID=U9UNY4_RHIID
MYNLERNLPPRSTRATRRAQRLIDERKPNRSIEHYDTMTDFMKSYCDSNNSEHQIILYKEMEEFNKHFGSNTHTTVRNRVYHFLPPGASTDTSDDTKEIERRPNKRIYASSTNLLPDFRSQVPK